MRWFQRNRRAIFELDRQLAVVCRGDTLNVTLNIHIDPVKGCGIKGRGVAKFEVRIVSVGRRGVRYIIDGLPGAVTVGQDVELRAPFDLTQEGFGVLLCGDVVKPMRLVECS